MRSFKRGNDSFQLSAKAEAFERVRVAGENVFGPSAIMKKRVLGADRGIVQAGGNRMRVCDLSVRILQNVGHGSVQHANAPATGRRAGVKSGGVVSHRLASAAGFHSEQTHLLVCDERMKQADSIRPTSDAREQCVRQFSGLRKNLLTRFTPK